MLPEQFPIEQGLKPDLDDLFITGKYASRAISNRTRIETPFMDGLSMGVCFLPEQFPIEQGLKRVSSKKAGFENPSSRAISNRTRIETLYQGGRNTNISGNFQSNFQ